MLSMYTSVSQALSDSLQEEKNSLSARVLQLSADLEHQTRTGGALQQQVADLMKQVAHMMLVRPSRVAAGLTEWC